MHEAQYCPWKFTHVVARTVQAKPCTGYVVGTCFLSLSWVLQDAVYLFPWLLNFCHFEKEEMPDGDRYCSKL